MHIGRKGEALLVYLAMQGMAGAMRSQLIARLWADHADRDARNALRQCLHKVRRATGLSIEGLDGDAERIVLRADACDLDVRRFEDLARCDDVPSMIAAAELYRGDFVEGLDAGADFALWVAAERERLRELAQRLLTRLSERASPGPASECAAMLARRLLAADPVHEGSYCALVRLHMRAGLRAKAAQVWSECRRVLRNDLGVEPSVQTTSTVRRLLDEPAMSYAPAVVESGISKILATSAGSFERAGGDAAVLDLVLRGYQQLSLFTPQGNRLARDAFDQAVALRADHAEAMSLLGLTHFLDSVSGWTDDPAAGLAAAARWAERAMACNGAFARPLQLQAKVLLWRMEHDAAIELLRSAVALEPGSAYAHFHLGEGAMWCGRADEALAHMDRALRLDANDHGIS